MFEYRVYFKLHSCITCISYGSSRGRVVKAIDSIAIVLCPRRFESCPLRRTLLILKISITKAGTRVTQKHINHLRGGNSIRFPPNCSRHFPSLVFRMARMRLSLVTENGRFPIRNRSIKMRPRFNGMDIAQHFDISLLIDIYGEIGKTRIISVSLEKLHNSVNSVPIEIK